MLSDALRPLTDALEIQETATRLLGEHLDVRAVNYGLVETLDGVDHYVIDRAYVAPGRRSTVGRWPITDFPGFTTVMHAGETMAVHDVANDPNLMPRDKAGLASTQTPAFVMAPLVKNGQPTAMLCAVEDRPRKWTNAEIALVQEVAERTWAAVERASAEMALREAEQRLQVLMEGIPQLVWGAVEDGRWTWASPQWTAFTGQEERDSHGWGWLDAVHPDDRERAQEAWANAVERGEFQTDYRVCHASEDRYRWFQTRATPVRDALGAIIEWLGTSTDVDDLRELQERQRVLVGELQHRTRNLLGVVRTMANRTGDTSDDFPDFRVRFQDRLEALARVQGLLSRLSDDDRVAFDELIETELKAMDNSDGQVTLDGPRGIRLRSSTVQMLGMALHELATNAVKYGALSKPDARLVVRWHMDPPDRRGRPWLRIDWRESGVRMPPAGVAKLGTGQGRELIEGALPYQLSAETSFELGPDGVHCAIAIPVSASNVQAESSHA
ncbi:PAS domain-containing protein [Altererythrobacter aurantiacus]|uniref:histidine kinase n=1 Tax=Parapontixanthobacter aurantiacus TaxID=1463599 RepID=A0A844ZFA3_9SPHN|nr:PAS domain-containing protein [Parapontixanthobacter aurantiacus]MXO84429.1 PAS domain-containing protein [Parapontixanthobacter aurantiacus]